MSQAADMHVHTNISCDSQTTMAEHCEAALVKGIHCLCFTDHADYNPKDWGCEYYNAEKYFELFKSVKEEYGDRLELLCGIEFGSPHVYQKEFESLCRFPYDFILCSVHDWYESLFASEMAVHPMPIEESYGLYWDEVFRMVEYGGFDALAHMDFPKRYYKSAVYDWDKLSGIFDMMVKNDIIPEINTSSLRKGLDEPMPGKELLDMYVRHGGRYVTLGSDAHNPEDLGAGFDDVQRLTEKLTTVKYVARKRTY